MKILFAAPFNYKNEGVTYFINLYYLSLARAAQRLGHKVKIVSTFENRFNEHIPSFLKKDFADFNFLFPFIGAFNEYRYHKEFTEYILDFKPDLLFVYFLDSCIKHKLIREIQEKGTKVVYWLGLNPAYIRKGIREILRIVDCLFIYDKNYVPIYKHKIGVKRVETVPLGIDLQYYDAVISSIKKTAEPIYDVSFLGILDKNRYQFFKYLDKQNFNIWTWTDLDPFPELKRCHRGHVGGHKAIEIMAQSKIVLNIHRDFEVEGGNYRLFEIPACRTMQLVDYRPGLKQYFKINEEIVTFKTPDEMNEKIKYYLRNPDERKEFVMKAYHRMKENHDIKYRVEKMLEIINKL
jgi:spore maturation protein CgeB